MTGISGKADKQKYDDLKAVIRRLEENNHSRLILFKSGKDWYKMAGNSLLIYKNSIAPLLKTKVNIQPDTDFTKTIFEDGVACFRGTESLKKKLEDVGKLRVMNEKNGVVVFELNFVVPQRQIDEYKTEMMEDREKSLAVLKPDIILLPEIYGKIKYVQKRIFEMVRKMTVYEREYNGMMMAKYSRELMKIYMMMNNDILTEDEGWEKVLETTNLLIIEVTFATELKILRGDVGANLGNELIDVRKAAERKLGRMGRL